MTFSDAAVFAELLRRKAALGRGGLMDFVQHATPAYCRPVHLAPLVALLEESRTRPVRCVVSVPPRHAKTETILHWIAQSLILDPSEPIAYVSYNADIAQEKALKAREIALAGGVKGGRIQKAERWTTSAGGCIAASGIAGGLTGRGYRKIIVDDPIKNHEEAESPTTREKVFHGFMTDVFTRKEPAGTSFFVVQTRWHRDDLAGRLIERGWPVINLPALDDNDEALAPHMGWTTEVMREERAETLPYVWSALYQGKPVARGAELFGEPSYYDTLPGEKYRIAIGVDLAYTKRTASDWSVAVVLYRHGDTYYIADVVRRQVRAPEFAATLKALSDDYGHAPSRWYCSGTELGAGDFIKDLGVRLTAQTTTADKFVRAMPVSRKWNQGKILVPRNKPWVKAFLNVVQGFTGVDDDHDDDVDALAAAFDQIGDIGSATWAEGVRAAASLPR